MPAYNGIDSMYRYLELVGVFGYPQIDCFYWSEHPRTWSASCVANGAVCLKLACSVLAEHQPSLFPILKVAERLLQSIRSLEHDGFTWLGPPAGSASPSHTSTADAAATATEQCQGTSDAAGSTSSAPAVASPESKEQPDQDPDVDKISDQVVAASEVEHTDVVGLNVTSTDGSHLSREGAFGTAVEAQQGPSKEPGASLGGDAVSETDLRPAETGQEPAAAAGVRQEPSEGEGSGEKGTPSEEEVAAYMRVIEGHAAGPLPGVLIAVGYPERIAQRQSRGNRCVHRPLQCM